LSSKSSKSHPASFDSALASFTGTEAAGTRSSAGAAPFVAADEPCGDDLLAVDDRSGYRCTGLSSTFGAPLLPRALCNSRRPCSIKRLRSSVAGLDDARDALRTVSPCSRRRDRSGESDLAAAKREGALLVPSDRPKVEEVVGIRKRVAGGAGAFVLIAAE
jgi:hypothetical protein